MAKKKKILFVVVAFSSLTLIKRVRRPNIRKTTGKQKPVISAIGNGRQRCSENLVFSGSEVSALCGRNRAESWQSYLEPSITAEAHGGKGAGTGKLQPWVMTRGPHFTKVQA